MASLLNFSGSSLLDRPFIKQSVTLSFSDSTVNALTTDGTKIVLPVTSNVQGLTYTYTSSNTTIASINGNTITILKSGSVTITASFSGNDLYSSASASYTLVISKANVTLSFTNSTVSTTTSESSISVQTVTSSVNGLTITYSSSDSSVATISGTTITIVGEGSTTITASFAGNEIYNSASATYSLSVTLEISVFATYEFNYTGAVLNMTLSAGLYKLQCWGASGGYNSNTSACGKGGYSEGILTLTSSTTIYVYVGGQGSAATTNNATASGGFNGGGDACASNWGRSSGGGGSDIRIGQDSLYARVIIAGGGGGSVGLSTNMATEYTGSIGHGGGTNGLSGGAVTGTSQGAGTRGTQTAGGTNSTTSDVGGSFGQGGGSLSAKISGGGGGWYGGAGGSAPGGGSGYVYTSSTASNYPSGCLLNSSYYLTNAQTIAGNTSFESISDSTETGHIGNGHVRITYINPLPDGYTAFDYIENVDNAYINTGVNAADDIGIHIEYEDNYTYGSVSNYIVGARASSSSTILMAISGSSTNNTMGISYNGGSTSYSQGTLSGYARTKGKKYVVDMQADSTGMDFTVVIDNDTPIIGRITATLSSSSTPICLFAFNSSNIKKNTRIYKCYILQGGTYVRYFIPCKNNNNVVGMYDVINGVFYGSANTYSFTAGNTI